ncbi:MAG TPA: hypothetical protein VG676_04540 [Chitinophagaceae bacterium]|jgi:hypothetical protein|nr:hypothetical protein [Chitinophagaceae bacterium]
MKEVRMKTIANRSFILFLVTSFIVGCKGPVAEKKNATVKNNSAPSVQYHKPSSSFNDTLVVSSTAAVFFNPDSSQLGKIKIIMEKDEYETEVHNCFFLMRNARRVLKQYWPQVHIIEISKVRYLLFIKSDKSKVFVDLNTKSDMCGIFLFNRKKDPELVDMMNIDTALGFYFTK